jgi:hypothetical protein
MAGHAAGRQIMEEFCTGLAGPPMAPMSRSYARSVAKGTDHAGAKPSPSGPCKRPTPMPTVFRMPSSIMLT